MASQESRERKNKHLLSVPSWPLDYNVDEDCEVTVQVQFHGEASTVDPKEPVMEEACPQILCHCSHPLRVVFVYFP